MIQILPIHRNKSDVLPRLPNALLFKREVKRKKFNGIIRLSIHYEIEIISIKSDDAQIVFLICGLLIISDGTVFAVLFNK